MVVQLTREGFERLQKELAHLKGPRRREVIEALATARAHGDLRENAEYDAAKEAQAQLEKRIAALEMNLAEARVIDEERIEKDKAFLGATLTLRDAATNREFEYTLVSKEEADFSAGRISMESPVGRALLGKKAGEKVEIKIPAGTTTYQILKIERRG